MKGKLWNKILIIVLLAAVVGAGVFAAVKLLGKPAQQVGEKRESKTVQLLSFDTYEEITGAKIRLENEFGNLDVNTDEKYITEGKGSLAVFPQGDYNRETWHPYMLLDCRDSSIATNDFLEFKSLTMDVYNSSKEEKQIAVNLTMANYSEKFMDTPSVIFTLKPGEWTECTYDIAENVVSSYFNLANVRYIEIVFLDHKEAKNDAIDALYFDNLYATKYDVVPEVALADYDFYKGVGFEDIAEQYLLSEETASTSKMSLQRVTYQDMGMEAPEGFGEWMMTADVTGSIWPSFWIHYGEMVPKDTILTFWAYVEVDNEEDDSFHIISHTNGHGTDRVANTVVSKYEFNKWIEVKVLLNDKSDVAYSFFNFDDFDTTAGDCRFGNKPVKIYMDNFKLEKGVESVTVDEAGNVTLRNPVGAKTLTYVIDQPFKKGETVAFDLDFNTKESIGLWILADGKWNSGDEINEFRAEIFETWEGKRMIMTEIKKDVSNLTLSIQYLSGDNLEANVCTISNIRKVASRAQVQANGDVVITNPAGDKSYRYEFTRPVKKGQRIAFDIDFNTKEAVAIWLLAEGKWEDDMWYGYGYSEWDGKKTIVVEAKRDISFFAIQFQYRGTGDLTKNVCTISNVKVVNQDVSVGGDGTITINNYTGSKAVFYNVMKPVSKDKVIRFNIDFNSGEPVAVWVLGEGKWDQDKVFYEYGFDKWDGKREILAQTLSDAEWYQIRVQYRGDTDPGKRVCTISNLGIEDLTPSVVVDGQGNVTLNNRINPKKSVYYDVQIPATQGGKMKFDIDFNSNEAVGIWVLADGKWDEEGVKNVFYEYGYPSWTGKQTIEAPILHDADSLRIHIQYRGAESNWPKNVAKISNIRVLLPDVTVNPDGSVALRNEEGKASVSYDVAENMAAGSKVVFDVGVNVTEPMTLKVQGVVGEETREWLADAQWDGSTRTVTVDVPEDVEKVRVSLEYRNQDGDYENNIATISNIVTSTPSAGSTLPDADLNLTYSAVETDDAAGQYAFVLTGDTAGQMSALHNQKVTVYVDGVENTADAYFANQGDGSLRMILPYSVLGSGKHLVQLKQGTKIGEMTVATDVVLYVDDKAVEAYTGSLDVTLTAGALADNGTDRYVIKLDGLTEIQKALLEGKDAQVYVDGVKTTGAVYADNFGGAIRIRLPYGVVKDGATSASQVGTHMVQIKKGTQLGALTIANSLTVYVNNSQIEKFESETEVILQEAAIANTDRYLVRFQDLTTQQINMLKDHDAQIYVDDVKVTGATFFAEGGSLKLSIPYSVVQSGATSPWDINKPHLIQIKQGTQFGGMTIIEDFNIYGYQNAPKKFDGATNVSPQSDVAADQPGRSRYVIKLKNLTAHQMNILNGKDAKVYIDGVQVAGATFGDLDSALRLGLPYNVVQSGATSSAQIGEHVIQIKKDTNYAGLTMAEDFTIYVKGATIKVFTGSLDIDLQAAAMGHNGSSQYVVKLQGLTKDQMDLMNGKPVPVYVDGEERSGATFGAYDGTAIRLCLPNDVVQEGATGAAQVKPHLVQVKKGTQVGLFTISEDYTIYINETSISAFTGDQSITLEAAAMAHNGTTQYVVKLQNLSVPQMELLNGKDAKVYVDGVQVTGATFGAYDGTAIRLCLPNGVIQEGAEDAAHVGAHLIQVKKGTQIGALTIAEDYTLFINGASIAVTAESTDITLDAAAMGSNGTTQYVVKLQNLTKQQMYLLNGRDAKIYVDGQPVEGATFGAMDATAIRLVLPYGVVQTGATSAAEVGEHTVQIKKNTTIGALNITNEFIVIINNDSIIKGN